MQNFLNSTSALAPAVIATAAPGLLSFGSPEMSAAFWVAVGIVTLLAGTNEAMKFFKNFREHPPVAQTYATKEELKICRQEFVENLRKLEGDLREYNRAQEDRASKIHSRVDQILAAVNRIDGIVEGQRKKS